MILRDRFGYFHDMPDQYGDGLGEVVYDGFGNPLGALPFLAALAPLAAKAAGALLPMAASALPGLFSSLAPRRASAPAAPPPVRSAQAPPPSPAAAVPAIPVRVAVPMSPPVTAPGFAPTGTQQRIIFVHLVARRRPPARMRYERVTEQVTMPHPGALPVARPPVSFSPPPPLRGQVATESRGGLTGYGSYAPFYGFA